jgi:acyl carrier protein
MSGSVESQAPVDQIRQLLAETFLLPLDEIPPDLAFGDLPQWDSMGHMNVIMALEERFGVEVSAEMIGALTSVEAICKSLEGKALHG